MTDDNPMDPKENPANTGHLPVSGEVGVGSVPYHDPVTTDTNDDPEHEPSIDELVEGASDDPSAGNMPPSAS
jgi:hypothetical protein